MSYLTKTEEQQAPLEPGSTKQSAQENCIHRLFEEQVEQSPYNVAITFEGSQISYQELNARSNQIAHALTNLNLKVNQPVAILLENGPQQIEAMFGVLKAGCLFVCLDPAYPTNRIIAILEESKPPLLITESTCLERHTKLLGSIEESGSAVFMPNAKEAAAGQNGFNGTSYASDLLAACSERNPEVEIIPAHPAYIVYTSGSTGKPKGIVQSHRSFSQFIEWQSSQFDIIAPQRFAQWASIAYDASYCEIFGALCFGATLCMAKSSVRHDPPALVEWAKAEKITILQFVPSFCRQVIEILKIENQNKGEHPLPDLELLLLAGEALPVDLASSWLDDFPNPPKLFNLYGPSESVLATYYEVKEVHPDQRTIPIGRAIDGREILILDEKNQPSAPGVQGEIYIRSQYLTMGYFERPEETEKRFIQNPVHNKFSDPVYLTGDMGRWLRDENVEFGGRVDNMVKVRGIRIELGEIEFAISQHPNIKETVVLAREDTPGQKQLVAYLISSTGQTPKINDLRSFVRERLPEFMVPSAFMVLEALPVNQNGKVDRGALPVPEKNRYDLDETFVKPRDDIEFRLAKIWADVLDMQPVGIKDSFFDLGGHSLSAVQLFGQIKTHFNKKLPLATLFEAPTIEHLADILRDVKVQSQSLLVPMKPTGSKPPVFCAPGLGGDPIVFQKLIPYLDPERPFYGLRSQGLDGLKAPLVTTEDIAACFIEEIRNFQPKGPYFLAGYSSGCQVVFEMARQLEEQGHEAAFVGLFNYYLGENQLSPPNFFEKLAWHLSLYSGLTLERKITHFRNIVFEQIISTKLFKKLCNFYVRKELPLPPLLGYFGRVILINLGAETEYIPKAYSGRVTLFRAEDVEHDPQLGLPSWAASGVDVQYVSGGHVSMLKEPNAQGFAKKLSACLDKAGVEEAESVGVK